MNLMELFATNWQAVGLAYVVSLLLCVVLVVTQDWHGQLTHDQSSGIQKFHVHPTPRIGGVPIFLGGVVASYFIPTLLQDSIHWIYVAALPAFLSGLIEDVTKRVGVLARLMATVMSGMIAIQLTGYTLNRTDLFFVDWVLQNPWLAMAFTAFAVGGVANAINIIDGMNGLASSMSIYAFAGLGFLALGTDDVLVASLCLVMVGTILGFFFVNWPFGKIFLGDGGSYFIGFMMSWAAVMLLARNQEISAFAVLLVCAYPVIEVLFSIFRRKVRKEHPGMPDRLHFHSLIKSRYVKRHFSHFGVTARNSITGLLVGAISIVPAGLAQLTQHSAGMSALVLLAFVLGYVAIYARIVRHKWCSPIHFLMVKPKLVRG